ncbi:MAG: hypothetical protein KAR13_02425 [Desulfobulbaceae bacterium]|nr:hypothetical protein [Desulfobulbaceae bacterium]MCK5323758.1 hypothetical protein [Desulfobulbaceae bacterium]MCK5436764.1 hypothetical protein [Desulfobulbaceae bacterium]
MEKNIWKSELLLSRKLSNDVELSFYNESKKIVGDRWDVRIRCEVVAPLPDDYFSNLPEKDPVVLEKAREKFGKTISKSFIKGQVFVSDDEIGEVLTDIIDRVSANIVSYVSHNTFAWKLFQSRFNEIRKEILLDMEYENIQVNNEDDGGPVDFSSCFKD